MHSTTSQPVTDTAPAAIGRVTVILAAYTPKRLPDLRSGLAALDTQSRRPDEVLLIIDNNPDLARTARLELASLFEGLRIVENHGPNGAAAARNAGAMDATGDILVFLDDDAAPDHTWLAELVAPLSDPDVKVTGGRARPAFPDGLRPAWFPTSFDWVVGCHPDHTPTFTHDVRNVWGVSMAVRAADFAAQDGFNTQFGRVGTTPLGCEETELCIRIGQDSPANRIVMAPASMVSHTVPAARCLFSYFWSRCYAEGLSKALIARTIGTGDALKSEKSYATGVLPRAALAGVRDALRGDVSGLARTASVVAGTFAAGVGYLRGRMTR